MSNKNSRRIHKLERQKDYLLIRLTLEKRKLKHRHEKSKDDAFIPPQKLILGNGETRDIYKKIFAMDFAKYGRPM